jgi:hypothetical protein
MSQCPRARPFLVPDLANAVGRDRAGRVLCPDVGFSAVLGSVRVSYIRDSPPWCIIIIIITTCRDVLRELGRFSGRISLW